MFVLGCHRSGTSLLAGIISDVLTDQKNSELPEQLSAQVDNPGGFFESRQLVDMNETLLGQLGVDWQHPPLHAIQWQRNEFLPRLHAARESFTRQALNQAWVDKDPRLCLTYPAYQHILLKRTPIAAVIRHPFEVAGSLHARDMIPLAKGLIIWFLYNQHLSRSLINSDMLISYESMVNLEEKAIHSLSTFISDSCPEINSTTDSIRTNLSQKVQPYWKRNDENIPNTFLPEIEWQEIAEICTEIYKKTIVLNYDIKKFQSNFADTPGAILRGCAVLGWQKMPAIAQDLTSELQAARLQLNQLQNSKSWKLTAPLRWLGDRAKRKK